ncbi:AP2/ERF and B3 domain-containing transcription factor RAV1-like [Apium graveolens]|uniref:AP2/ERF and B3 domain-containing transcription factor RAV1-like n=1 Tax=Apium graveolens TaxID=4045 RepID=UPI003D78FFC0
MAKEISLSSPPERVKLFDKVVSLSDIKQHRLAIPKLQAKMHFPLPDASSSRGTLLRMHDSEGKLWRFRFIFWKSYQGYVLTSEWNQFVREKGLSVGDTVSFYRSTAPEMQLYVEYTLQANRDATSSSEVVFEQTPDVQEFKLFGVTISSNVN